jgi:hypothetical protein
MTIDKLIEAVEDHEIDQNSPRFDADLVLCWDAFPSDTPPVSTNARHVLWAWGGDINEAKNLHAALLPGVSVKIFGTSYNEWRVQISGTDAVWGPDPARAWLLAILKAKQAEGRG